MLQWLTDLTEEAHISIRNDELDVDLFTIVRLIVNAIRTYRKEHDLPVDKQIRVISDHLKAFYQNPDLSERAYLALWKIYEEKLHDPEMEEAGKVIFVPDGPEHEREGLHYLSSREPRHRLMWQWCFTEKEKRENTARVTLRRYTVLVANVDLRKKVFGF